MEQVMRKKTKLLDFIVCIVLRTFAGVWRKFAVVLRFSFPHKICSES